MNENQPVFISYKAEEVAEASWVKSVLEKNGIACWMAPMSIQGGASYAVAIPQAINNCEVFVLILSEQAQKSKWVPKEIDRAINANKVIMPFAIENCMLNDEFNFYLTNVQRYDAYCNKVQAMKKMVHEIKAILRSRNRLEEPMPDEEAKAPTSVAEAVPSETQPAVHVPAADNRAPDQESQPVQPAPASLGTKSKNTAEPAGNGAVSAAPRKGKAKKADTAKKSRGKIIGIVAAALVAIFLFLLIAVSSDLFVKKVTIAGEPFKANVTSVSFSSPKTLTQQDIDAIVALEDVTYVDLSACKLPDGAFAKLAAADLSSLYLDDCGLDDAQIQAATTFGGDLHILHIKNNQITNISSLALLSETLSNLDISGNSIQDFSVLKAFRLESLWANQTGLTDLDFLSNSSDLSELYVNENNLSSLESLAGMENLQTLEVSQNQLHNFKGLENALHLSVLKASSNQLTSLDGLNNATVLSILNVDDNQIRDISLLAKSAETLRCAYFRNNAVSDISPLAACAVLEEVGMSNNAVTALDALANKPNLKILLAENNAIASIEPLQTSSQLYSIDLSGNQITDAQALSTLTLGENVNGLTLDLSDNQLTEFTMPAVQYSYLDLHGNAIKDLTSVFAASGSKLVLSYADGMDLSGAKDAGAYNIYFVDCPMDKKVQIEQSFLATVHFISAQDVANL